MQVEKYLKALGTLRQPEGHRVAVMQITKKCNRQCSCCGVWSAYRPEKEPSIERKLKTVDRLSKWGFRTLIITGGEPLGSEEGNTALEHTLAVTRYAVEKEMVVGMVSNGDSLTRSKAKDLKRAGLDAMTLSLHDNTREDFNHLIKCGRWAAEEGVAPVIQPIVTRKTARHIPGMVLYAMANGIPFSVTLLQEKGKQDGLSSAPKGESLMASKEQQKAVLAALHLPKTFGFVRNNRNFLSKSLNYYPNQWVCAPPDNFIYIGAEGTVDVCPEIGTGLSIDGIENLSDYNWRILKEKLVGDCTGCLLPCNYEVQNPCIMGDLTTIGVAAVIKHGGADYVRKWGQVAARMIRYLEPNIDWSLNLN